MNHTALLKENIFVPSETSNRCSLWVIFNDQNLQAQASILSAFQMAGFEVCVDQDDPHLLRIDLDAPLDPTILDILLPVIQGLNNCRNFSFPKLQIQNGHGAESGSGGYKRRRASSEITTRRLGELAGSIQALLLNASDAPLNRNAILQVEDLILDPNKRQVYKNNRPVSLTPLEFRLLTLFMQHPGEVLSKDTLLRQVWGCANVSGDFNLIDTAIRRLRLEIEDNPRQPRYLHTAWGSGYRFGERSNPDCAEPA